MDQLCAYHITSRRYSMALGHWDKRFFNGRDNENEVNVKTATSQQNFLSRYCPKFITRALNFEQEPKVCCFACNG